MLKEIATVTLMLLSYLVTEGDNKAVCTNDQAFPWLVSALDSAIHEGSWSGLELDAIEVVEVGHNLNSINGYLEITFRKMLIFGIYECR